MTSSKVGLAVARDGLVEGFAVGLVLGDADGLALGLWLGAVDGLVLGLALGTWLGNNDGLVEGLALGTADGDAVVGDVDGNALGRALGDVVGLLLGLALGIADGACDGDALGLDDGRRDGLNDGLAEGAVLGLVLGEGVGASVEHVPSVVTAPGLSAHAFGSAGGLVHTREPAQSRSMQHPSPVVSHGGHSGPPQFLSVSVPLMCVSSQLASDGDADGAALGDALGAGDGLVLGLVVGLSVENRTAQLFWQFVRLYTPADGYSKLHVLHPWHVPLKHAALQASSVVPWTPGTQVPPPTSSQEVDFVHGTSVPATPSIFAVFGVVAPTHSPYNVGVQLRGTFAASQLRQPAVQHP